jgi:hypothetical protein
MHFSSVITIKTPLEYLKNKADLAKVLEPLPLLVDSSINNIKKLLEHTSYIQLQSIYKPHLKKYISLKVITNTNFFYSIEQIITTKGEAFKDSWFQCGICHMPKQFDIGDYLFSLLREVLRELGRYFNKDNIKNPYSTEKDLNGYSRNTADFRFYEELLNIEY